MALLETRYEHIVLDEGGTASIAGTQTKVIELVLDKIAYGWSPEELSFQHPHLTLGQVHSALAYYWDHRDQLDAEIERRLAEMDRLRAESGSSPLARKLKAQGLL